MTSPVTTAAASAAEATRSGRTDPPRPVSNVLSTLADAEPGLIRVLPELREREIWIAVHGDLRRSARARVGLEFLAAVLSSERSRLSGAGAPPATPRTRLPQRR